MVNIADIVQVTDGYNSVMHSILDVYAVQGFEYIVQCLLTLISCKLSECKCEA